MLPKTILVPTDFSQAGDAALDYAIELARKVDGNVVLLTAFELPAIGYPDGELVYTEDLSAKTKTLAEHAVEDAVAKRKECGVPLRALVKRGDPRDVILEAVEETGANLIVMSTHGRRGVARAVMGSTAESIVRHAKIPVLTVRMAL